ncbi:hypothetical protein GGR56DRAFT_242171 [Xylariaceae sp. FL0804]|nr:hypothetical protein GGR56DRAFT_242171 [Xylariaceae sp. FL0804]
MDSQASEKTAAKRGPARTGKRSAPDQTGHESSVGRTPRPVAKSAKRAKHTVDEDEDENQADNNEGDEDLPDLHTLEAARPSAKKTRGTVDENQDNVHEDQANNDEANDDQADDDQADDDQADDDQTDDDQADNDQADNGRIALADEHQAEDEAEDESDNEADDEADDEADEDKYIVDKLVNMRINDETQLIEYQVKWVGYPTSANTWEPIDHLSSCTGKLLKFMNSSKGKQAANSALAAYQKTSNSD